MLCTSDSSTGPWSGLRRRDRRDGPLEVGANILGGRGGEEEEFIRVHRITVRDPERPLLN